MTALACGIRVLRCCAYMTCLEAPVVSGHTARSVGTGMGIAVYPYHGDDPSTPLKCVAVVMYIARRDRNDVLVYDEARDTGHPEPLDLHRDLYIAIPRRGPVSPVDCVPVLAQPGLIKPHTPQEFIDLLGADDRRARPAVSA